MSPSFRIQDIPGKGVGAVALETIPAGTLIASDSPIIIVSRQTQQISCASSVLPQLQTLQSSDQKAFFALANNFTAKKPPIEGIVKTNAMPLGNDSTQGGVFLECARFNHTCVANAAYSWNEDVRKERIYAIREIGVGEEIVVGYLRSGVWNLPREERKQRILVEFGFECCCVRCGDGNEEEQARSDARRTRLAEIDQAVGGDMLIMTNPGKALAFCREALTLLKEEEKGCPQDETVYYDALQVCVCHGDMARAKAFAALAAKAKRAWQGQDASGLQDYETYSRKPEAHRLAFQTKKWFVSGKAGATPPSPYTDEWLWRRAG